MKEISNDGCNILPKYLILLPIAIRVTHEFEEYKILRKK